ncbi:heat shock 70kDa protein 8 [Trichonephila clavipes]|nr:heat shock 70kDa protein 8 [Trichonephila clavipes]
MVTNFFIPELNNHDVQELWVQQDGTTCHTARATIDLLKETFGDRLISRFGPVNWPPRSCDLTPLDYFLTATAGSDVVQSGRPIFDDFFLHLWPYIGNNTANFVFQMVKRLWLIRIDQ